MYTWIWVFSLYSWKIEKFTSKIRISKDTDYAALKVWLFEMRVPFLGLCLDFTNQFEMT